MRRMLQLDTTNQKEKNDARIVLRQLSIKSLPLWKWFLIIGIGCLAIGFYMGYEFGFQSGINSVMTYFKANPMQCFGL